MASITSRPICSFCYKSSAISSNSQVNDETSSVVVYKFFRFLERHLSASTTAEPVANLMCSHILNCCDDCLVILDGFCDDYHKLKCIEMQMEWKLQRLINIMKLAGRVPSRVEQLKEMFIGVASKADRTHSANDSETTISSYTLTDFKRCRQKVMKRCTRLISQSQPRVLLKRNTREEGKFIEKPKLANATPPTSSPFSGNGNETIFTQTAFDAFLGWSISFVAVINLLNVSSCQQDTISYNSSCGREAETLHKIEFIDDLDLSMSDDNEASDRIDDLDVFENHPYSLKDDSSPSLSPSSLNVDIPAIFGSDNETNGHLCMDFSATASANIHTNATSPYHILQVEQKDHVSRMDGPTIRLQEEKVSPHAINFNRLDCVPDTASESHDDIDISHARVLVLEPIPGPSTRQNDSGNNVACDKGSTTEQIVEQIGGSACDGLTDIGPYLFWCSKCGYTCNDKQDLHKHMTIHTKISSLTCPFCDKVFPNHRCLTLHIRMEHIDKGDVGTCKITQCSQCDKKFIERHALNQHINSTHVPPEQTLKCKECGTVCRKRSDLKRHKLIHKGRRTWKFHCSKCEFGCNEKGRLGSHMIAHAKGKISKCQFCDKEFVSTVSLSRHVRTEHIDKGDVGNNTVYSCYECDMKYLSKKSLLAHMKNNHTGRRFQCAECGRDFKTSCDLIRHTTVTHTDPNTWKFQCSECGKRFHLKPDLTRHLITYHNKSLQQLLQS